MSERVKPFDSDMTEACDTSELSQLCLTGYFLVSLLNKERTPIVLARTPLAGSQGAWLVFEDDQLWLEVEPESCVKLNEQPALPGSLQVGDVIDVAGSSFCVERSQMLAFLEGLTPPHQGMCWPLSLECATIGRPGKRENSVPLLDRTVSREQAKLDYVQDRFVLTAEAPSSTTTVNGRAVERKTVLRNGDLLGFGQQILRFQSAQDTFGSRKGTVFFCDVWDYSKLFHERAVHDVALQMKEFYEAAGESIETQNGLVLRYIGDALLASFSEPGHADSAVLAGKDLHRRLALLNESWVDRGMPALKVGVGINSGEFALGHMGFAGYIEFGALGADVNMAARIEKLTRENEAKILIGESTKALMGQTDGLVSIGKMSLKGAESEMEVFEVFL